MGALFMESSRRRVLQSVVGAGGIAAAASFVSAQPAAAATTSVSWYNVMDYGATGNGTTDDTTAVYGAGADNGSSTPSVTAGPDNRSGQVTFTTGSAPTTGSQVKVTFGAPFAVTPVVMITPGSGATAGLLCAVESVSETGFSLYTGGTPAANTSYSIYWYVAD